MVAEELLQEEAELLVVAAEVLVAVVLQGQEVVALNNEIPFCLLRLTVSRAILLARRLDSVL